MDHVIAEQRQGVSNRCPRIYFTAGIRKASGSRGLCSSEDEIPLDDPRHQVPIGLATQSQPIHMETLVAALWSRGHERRVKAFIDEKLHEVEPDGLGTFSFRRTRRFTDFTFRPCSESSLGRPLAGWAATQISASSTIRSVSEG